MSERQWKKLDVVERIERGALTVMQAAVVLGLSRRQVQRLRCAVAKRGRKGVIHGHTGRPAPNRIEEKLRERVVELWRTKYPGANDHHFTELLAEEQKLSVSRATVQRLLRAAGIGPTRKRRPPKHRRRRDRKPQAGLMILWDGSRHDWLEERGPRLCLMAAIDDATSEVLPGAHFFEQECAAGYLGILKAIAEEKGLPCSVYMDRHSALRRNDEHWTLEEELRGEQDPTQVGLAHRELDIEMIYALSPQAKGRVERLWGTLQDRLTSELRFAGARTVEEGNAVLERYRLRHNRRFAVAPADATAAWRPVRKGLDLAWACSFRHQCTVYNDNTVRLSGLVIDVPPGPGKRSYAKARVDVRQLLDGSWQVRYRGAVIATAPRTDVGELRARHKRKKPAASRAFRKAIERVAASLP